MSPRAGLGRAISIALAALGLLAPNLTGSRIAGSLAVFSARADLTGNTFATIGCFRAELNRVLTGTATSTGNGTLSVTISSVDPAKSFLMFQTRHASNRPVGSSIRGNIANATTLEFVRVTDETSTMTIRWYVVEYLCGLSVQRGEFTGLSAPADVAITPVKSTAQAFVLWSKTALAADTSWDQNEALVADLSSTDTVRFRSDGNITSHTVSWQVVEFTNAADVAVQRGSTSITGTATSATVTLPAAVTTTRTFLLADLRTTGTGGDVGARMLRARLTNSTTLTFDRSATGGPDDITEIGWQVVELKDGSRVQSGSAAFAGGSQATASLTSIRTNRAAAFASVQSPGGQNMGRSPYTGDDIVGVGSATLALSSTQVTLDRGSTADSADIAWFVVEWSRPWWDANYSYRKKITVTAGTATAPSGYSVALTIDHAALVAAGKSRSNGDDIRVMYWNGSAWIAADRVLDESSSWNTSTTKIWFATKAELAADGADHDYYLYYGYSSATNPPANKANVYLAYHDFTGATVGQTPSGWTVQAGGPWQVADDAGNRIVRRLSSGGTTGVQYLRLNGLSETNVLVQSRIRMTAGAGEDLACVLARGAGTGASDISGYRMCLLERSGRYSQRARYVSGTLTEIQATTYSWSDATWYTVAGATYGSTVRQWINGSLVATNTDSSLSQAGTVGMLAAVGAQIDYDFDNFLVRRYVESEPVTSLGAETT